MVQLKCVRCGMYVEDNQPCNCGKCWVYVGTFFLFFSFISFCASFTTYNNQYTYSTLSGVIFWICALALCHHCCKGKPKDRILASDQTPLIIHQQDPIIIQQAPPYDQTQRVQIQQPPVQTYQAPQYIQYQQPPSYQQPPPYAQQPQQVGYQQQYLPQQQIPAPVLAQQQFQYPPEPIAQPILENWDIPQNQGCNDQNNVAKPQQEFYGKNI